MILFIVSIIVIILIIIIFTGIFLTNGRDNNNDNPVDIVYTWVEMDSSLQTDLEKYTNPSETRPLSPYRDTNELLYSLRSICLFAPWFNHVYLVVRDGQKPHWLNTNCKKITLVSHSDIIPSQYLPTFNSIVIEAFLHRIPNLSEQYLYFNDDIMLWNSTKKNMFFTNDEKCIESSSSIVENILPLHPTENYIENETTYEFMKMMEYNATLLKRYLNVSSPTVSLHTPFPNLKSVNYELDEFLTGIPYKHTNQHDHTNHSKFRNNENIARMSIFQKYFYKHRNKCILQSEESYSASMIEVTHLESKRMEIQKLVNNKNTVFVNFQNNIEYEDINAPKNGIQDMQLIQKVLQEKFKSPCIFENKKKLNINAAF